MGASERGCEVSVGCSKWSRGGYIGDGGCREACTVDGGREDGLRVSVCVDGVRENDDGTAVYIIPTAGPDVG